MTIMCKRIILPILILLLVKINAFAYQYALDSIPSKLRIGADAVVRTEQMVFTILEAGKAIERVKIAITLLNENASEYRYASVPYDKFNKIKYVKASVYDEKGRLVKIIKPSEILDMSAISGGVFYSDDRVKLIIFPLMKYPFTIEYEYETSVKSILNYPSWSFQDSPDVSVEKSGIQFIVPKNMSIRFKELNLKYKVDSISIKDKFIYTWQEDNIPTVKTNSYGIPFANRNPRLLAAPFTFEYDGYAGSMKSWKSLGEWNQKIIEGRDVLPDAEIAKIKDLVKDISDERLKVKAVYEYMQSRTRYVAISLGIGGLQPFEAKLVTEKGYGDCKALTNYTMALLKSIGIKSYYALVKSGSFEHIDPNFVSNQFDHVILCVPQPNDTVWLECTSQSLPFNYLSDFTSDRHVLLTTPGGGELAHTPDFKRGENVYKFKGVVNIDKLLNTTTASFTYYSSGIFYGKNDFLAQQSEDEIKRHLNESLSIPTFQVTKVAYHETKTEKPSSQLEFDMDIRDFTVRSSSRIYFTPCISKTDYLLNEPIAIQISTSYNYTDSLVYKIPSGYQVDYLPQNQKIETAFGVYSYSLSTNNDKVVFYRALELQKGKYPSSQFNEFYTFINAIAKSDRERVILKKM
jgi:hypothetical protein